MDSVFGPRAVGINWMSRMTPVPGACNGTAIFEGYPCGAKVNDYTLSIGCEASTPFCPADVDGNLNVGVLDLVEVIVNWGDCGDPGDCPGDVNGDGTIGVGDLIEVIVNWGPCFGQG